MTAAILTPDTASPTPTPADVAWWAANAPVQSARVWHDGPYLFELIERPGIERGDDYRFVLSTWHGPELVERKGFDSERMATIWASVKADPMQFEDDEAIEFSDDANGQFGYTREEAVR